MGDTISSEEALHRAAFTQDAVTKRWRPAAGSYVCFWKGKEGPEAMMWGSTLTARTSSFPPLLLLAV